MKHSLPKLLMVTSLIASTLISNQAKAEERYCREFTSDYTIGGEVQQGYGTACLAPDGSWEIVSQNNPVAAPIAPAREEPRRYTSTPTPLVEPGGYYVPAYGNTVGSEYYYDGPIARTKNYYSPPRTRYVEKHYYPTAPYLAAEFLRTWRYLDRKHERKRERRKHRRIYHDDHHHYDHPRRDRYRDRYRHSGRYHDRYERGLNVVLKY